MLVGFPLYFLGFGVDLFFVLSGYLMVAITSGESSPGRFLVSRICRIVPLYWIATLAFVVCQVLLGYMNDINFRHLAASLLFIPYQPYNATNCYPVLAPGWTLNYEMIFYIAFAASLWFPRLIRLPLLSLVFIATVVAGLVTDPNNTPLSYWSSPIILEFLIGAWLAQLTPHGVRTRRDSGWFIISLGVALLFALFLVGWWTDSVDPEMDWRKANALRTVCALPAALVLLGALKLEPRANSGVFIRTAVTLGDASYSIYLWQVVVFSLAVFFADLFHPAAIVMFLGVCFTCIAVGYVSYLGIERPLMTYFARKRRDRTSRLIAGNEGLTALACKSRR